MRNSFCKNYGYDGYGTNFDNSDALKIYTNFWSSDFNNQIELSNSSPNVAYPFEFYSHLDAISVRLIKNNTTTTTTFVPIIYNITTDNNDNNDNSVK